MLKIILDSLVLPLLLLFSNGSDNSVARIKQDSPDSRTGTLEKMMVADGSAVLDIDPETFAQNPNANAIRWGTLYNFRFDSDRPPQTTNATIGFFKTGTPLPVPIQSPSGASPTPVSPETRVNVALASNGATATASSTHSPGFAPSGTINGQRSGSGWGAGGGWNDATAGVFPDTLEVAFNAPQTIEEVDVFSVQDNYQSPVEPSEAQTFTLYGLTNFEVQYWDGAQWQLVPGGVVTGNNLVWRKFTFAAVTTTRIRVVVNDAADHVWSRVTELEAYTSGGATPTPGADFVWVEDTTPAGATLAGDGEGWSWVGTNPAPFSGTLAHQSNIVGAMHQHYFFGATQTLTVGAGETLFAYVYLDPSNPPSQVMLQWNDGTWEHRAYWGANSIPFGVDGTESRRFMGPLPPSGQWVRLEVPASLVGLEGRVLNGAAFTLFGGRATWDRSGKSSTVVPTPTPTPGTRVNVALASNGGVAAASSTHSPGFAPSGTINGQRSGSGWGAGGGWNDATQSAFPDSLEVTFNGTQTIEEVSVFSLQDNYQSPVEPSEGQTFTLYGLTSFTVQYWDGAQWVAVPGGVVTGNNLVWRKVTFAPLSTTKVRVVVNDAADHVWSRIAEVEAYTPGGAPPPGGTFTSVPVASGISSPTAMAFAPDGRLFVCQQTGQLRVITSGGSLLATPFVSLTVNSTGERGLLGVAFDPNFAANQFVYVYYTATTPTIHNRVSRFTASGDVAAAGSEVVILDLENLSATNHNGGAIHFGPDGKLYVAVGENAVPSNAQTLDNRLGKMLRINADGTIPSDNPFFGTATGGNRAIWALGLRNPYTFAFQPGTGRMFINDVGQTTWEEINDGIAGSNYGWPTCEGSCGNPSFRDPLFQYGHGTGPATGCAITGGAFYNPAVLAYPSEYVGKYFYAEYCSGWIRRFDPATSTSTPFVSGLDSPVDLHVGPDGNLYYLVRGGGGAVFKITYSV